MTPVTRRFWIAAAAATFLIAALEGTSLAATVTVPTQYPTIQAAIDAVLAGQQPDGTTINVQANTYTEALVIGTTTKSLTVRAIGGSVIVDATGKGGAALSISGASGQIVFIGLTFQHGVAGGFVISASSPSFYNCIFQWNTAYSGGGGTLSSSNATFTTSVIQNNSAARWGGGVYIAQGSKPVFTSTDIINNVSGTGGAGVGNNGAGGGVFSMDSSPTLRASHINNNTSRFAAGGIYAAGIFGSPYGRAMLLVQDSEVGNNTSLQFPGEPNPSEGGGIHIEDNVTGTLTRVRVHDNSAGTGGGLNAYRARYDITDSVIESNHATAAVGIGGGISTNSNFATAQAPGSIVYLTTSLVRNNTAAIGGGIVSVGDNASGSGIKAFLTLTNSVVDHNTGQSQGGGILATRTVLASTGSMITSNTVSGGANPYGGGLLIATFSDATLNTTTIANNTASQYGGGLFVSDHSVINMSGSTVYANTASDATARGGGLFIATSDQSGTIANSIFADNNSNGSAHNSQIHEEACSAVLYQNNTVTPTAPSVQFSGCFTSQATSGGRVTGTNSNPPRFAHFLAVPSTGTSTTLAWSVGRATSVTIAGVGTFNTPTNSPTGTTNVAPGGSTTYSLTATATAPNGGNYSAVTAGFTFVQPPAPPTPPHTGRAVDGDFDGDGKSDITVFRPSTGVWYARGITTVTWGGSGDVPVVGDYDGDGKVDIAIFRPSTSMWYIRNIATVGWGGSGDIPVIGDYDGDGKSDIAIFRPSTSTWYIRNIATVGWGGSGDIPVIGDYDGDGKSDIAIFRPSTSTWYIRNVATVVWGGVGDIPVVADYDGDGKADVAVFRPSTGVWYIRGVATVTFGGAGDIPVPGDYNGDGKTEIAIFRPSSSAWYIGTLPGSITWGGGGDIPINQRP